MTRTTIVLPEEIKRLAVERARRAGISFAEFVRIALQRAVEESAVEARMNRRRSAIEEMLQFRDTLAPGPTDLSSNLDEYLYGGDPAVES
jgi:hypothetical protein